MSTWKAPLRGRIWYAIGKFAVRRANRASPKFHGSKPYWLLQPCTREELDYADDPWDDFIEPEDREEGDPVTP